LERDTICVAHGGVSRALRGIILELPPAEIVELDVPQDKVLKVETGQIEWL
jgi:broad specificity phosphatase PhoE